MTQHDQQHNSVPAIWKPQFDDVVTLPRPVLLRLYRDGVRPADEARVLRRVMLATSTAAPAPPPRRPRTFRQRDLTTAMKAAVAAGIPVEKLKVEVDQNGKITISTNSSIDDSPEDLRKLI